MCRPAVSPLRIVARIGLTALLVLSVPACRNPRKEAMRELEKRGVPPSGAALLQAVQAGDAELARLLLEAQVYTGQRDDARKT